MRNEGTTPLVLHAFYLLPPGPTTRRSASINLSLRIARTSRSRSGKQTGAAVRRARLVSGRAGKGYSRALRPFAEIAASLTGS